MFYLQQTSKFLLAIMLSFMLAACSSSSSTNILSGVAATGAGIDGFVFITDANGTEVNVATDPVTGEYTVDVTGMTPPFILKVVPNGAGATLFSFAAGSNQTINLTPLTDLAMFIASGNVDVDAIYNAWSGTQILNTAILTAQAVINANLSTQLTAAGLDPTTLDFFSNAFSTDGTGFDGVLDDITVVVDTTGGTFTIAVTGGGFTFNSSIDTSGVTIPGSSTGGGTGGGAAALPDALSGIVVTLEFGSAAVGAPYNNGDTVEFTFSSSGTLFIDNVEIASSFTVVGSEFVWTDATNTTYTVSVFNGALNEVNVGSASVAFLGQFAAVATPGTGSGTGSAGACTSVTLSNNTACVDYTGVAITIPTGNAIVGVGSFAGKLVVTFSQQAFGQGSPRINMNFPVNSTAGIYACDNTDGIVITSNNGTDDLSADPALQFFGTECLLVLTTVGNAIGDVIEGTFTSKMRNSNGGAIVDVSGKIKAIVE